MTEDRFRRRASRAWPVAVLAIVAALLIVLVTVLPRGATGYDPIQADAAITAGLDNGVPRLQLTVLGSTTHEGNAWTQGMEITDGVLYESIGRQGDSRLREVDLASRQVRREATPPRSSAIGGRVLGTGITVVGPRIWQLTEHDQVAVEWDRAELRPIRTVPMPGTGRGLCLLSDGRLIVSDGGDRLRLHSPANLALLGTVAVRIGARPLSGLGELECVPGAVWATVDGTPWLVRIDPTSGTVTGVLDTAALVPPEQRQHGGGVHGIAAIPGTSGFLVTGRLWPNALYVSVAE